MFTIWTAETFTGQPRYIILDFGYRTDKHPVFKIKAKAEAYTEAAAKDQVKVDRALAVKKEADEFIATLNR